MDSLFILAKVEEYFEEEFKTLIYGLENYDWMMKDVVGSIEHTLTEMVSICMFVQKLGVDYESIKKIYDDNYYEKLWAMKTKALKGEKIVDILKII